jgi:phospholipase C
MPKILQQIKHIVVVMFENRSLDDMCGWLSQDPASPPVAFLSAGSPSLFDGLNSAPCNPRNVSYFSGAAADEIPVMAGATSFTNRGIDPEETFVRVTYQI